MEPQIGPRFWPGFLKTLPPLRNVTYVVFFAAGMISALWAGLIPSLKTALNVDEGVLGTMLLGLGIGSLVMMPVTGRLVARWGCRAVMRTSLPLMAVFIVTLAFTTNLWLAAALVVLFGGALGVGLGFGLQKIASNYISGFIILIDRSIKIGDLVEAAGFRGRVTQINTRYTVVRNNDGIECIVPNENFVTSPVVNHSYTEEAAVQYISISIAYDADIDRALAIMLEEGMRERPRIVPGRKGWSYLESFGDSGINLKLGFWVKDPVNGTAGLRTAISKAIYQRFVEEGIEVPYNRLEINLRDAQAPAVHVKVEADTVKVD